MTKSESRPRGKVGSVQLVENRRVKAPQSEAFAYAADFANIEDWDPGVASSKKVTDGPVGVGSRYELDVVFGKTQIPMIYEITHYEEPDRVVLVGRGDKLEAVDEIRFRTDDGVTVIDYTADLSFFNYVRYLIPFMGSSFKKVGQKALDGLVKALDG